MRLALSILAMTATMISLAPEAFPSARVAKAQSRTAGSDAYFIEFVAERRVNRLPAGPLYWRIEEFATAAQAIGGEGPFSLAAFVSGRHLLFTLGSHGGRSRDGRLVAEIGPVARPSAKTYLLRINRAGGPPGSQTPVHTHPGSEAIYVLSGRVSQRTPHGVEHAATGELLNAHAPEMVMQLTSSGSVDLEQLVMFVVDADRPFSPPAKFDR